MNVRLYLRDRWLQYELTRRYHPLWQRRARQWHTTAATYCQQLSVWPLLQHSTSTGAGLTDYYLLHSYVVTKLLKRVLEFGSGMTTLILADALQQVGGQLVSLEDILSYHEEIAKLIPPSLRSVVTCQYAPKQTLTLHGLWGVRYSTEYPKADLIFVDGPTETVDGRTGICLDLLCYLTAYPDQLVDVLVDRKYGSLLGYQTVLPAGAVRHDHVMDVGFGAGLTGRMIRQGRAPWRISGGNVWDDFVFRA